MLYLQHGGGAELLATGSEVGRAEQILDNLWLSGQLADMIVVMGNGNVPDFSAELLDNLMPAVDEAYHVSNVEEGPGAGRALHGRRAGVRGAQRAPGRVRVRRNLRRRDASATSPTSR